MRDKGGWRLQFQLANHEHEFGLHSGYPNGSYVIEVGTTDIRQSDGSVEIRIYSARKVASDGQQSSR
jgi:hypothetical protein